MTDAARAVDQFLYLENHDGWIVSESERQRLVGFVGAFADEQTAALRAEVNALKIEWDRLTSCVADYSNRLGNALADVKHWRNQAEMGGAMLAQIMRGLGLDKPASAQDVLDTVAALRANNGRLYRALLAEHEHRQGEQQTDCSVCALLAAPEGQRSTENFLHALDDHFQSLSPAEREQRIQAGHDLVLGREMSRQRAAEEWRALTEFADGFSLEHCHDVPNMIFRKEDRAIIFSGVRGHDALAAVEQARK